jgi:L-seryl-tRNA(Ser) seleniumtransferase/D-glucosaminate-6-phosphate ammonia-lyase
MVALDACVEASRAQGVPVVVETAAESDLAHFLRLGADLVIYSGSKDLLGPTGGLVLGRRALVDAVRAQSSGIGRAMKIRKEAIVGMVDAIDGHMAMDHASSRRTPVRRPIGRSAARVARRHGARGSRDAPAGHRAGRTPVPWSAADMDVIEGALRALRSA